ncbi:carbamoyltransferase HypF [Methanobrevibacter cuticularis]|uniref:Carbamoyltransferase n=1 Tax=Methanobrevibacter cuticularis TaxID=47311 RepID=A0A166CTI6_9EURY|nr:carbamoyltransferase HypF [Methanobrevibacter cuticularis]KZX16707.1 carbamoyltransferase HypF [Methanobrevibacter cuticularis]
MKIAKIWVQGIVQGVGFRPTVYRIANALNLRGNIRNLGNIVEIILFENEKGVNLFLDTLKKEKPPIAKINSIELQWIDENDNEYDIYKKSNDFKILESSADFSGASVIPPDLAICDSCLKEIRDPNNRRYNYPFTACTDCGPRFTVIGSIPYDRVNTTMEDFPLCDECEDEYTDPNDRRYHAEASCCSICGPSLSLYKSDGKELAISNPLKKAVNLLDKGKILAIKGIGGTHLVAKVTDERPVKNLRKRLNRFNQPFAVMSSNLETVKTFAEVSDVEAKSLLSKERPIVVLKKSKNYYFEDNVAPELHNIGVMLPYSPLHHLLFSYTDESAYIMTSANRPGEPMMIENKEILKNLYGIADYYLLHDRKIMNRCDDSVIRYRNNELSFIRRSRGYAPEPYDLLKLLNPEIINKNANILSLGPELDVTFCIQKQGLAYVSQHIGNTNKFKTYEFLQESIEHLMNITKTSNFDTIACDMHPQFFTTQLGKELSEQFNANLTSIQHHHAHGAVLSADNSLDELVYIAADGVGYGDDGTAWGGEIIYTDIKSYERLGSLMPQKMPGGDTSTKYPIRMLTSILKNSYEEEELKTLLMKNYKDYFQYGEMEIKSLLKQLNSGLNVGITTSTGRILDSIAAALNICGKRTYEGESAMKLESFAYGAKDDIDIPIEIKKMDNRPVLDTKLILKDIMDKIASGENKKNIAAAGQEAVGKGLAEIAIEVAEKKGISTIGATGGVFYNEAITLATKKHIEDANFKFVQHRNSCAGDGSISLGQSIISSSLSK